MHISATISANQPVLVLAPVGEKPPSTVSSRTAASRPVPTMEPPHCSSCARAVAGGDCARPRNGIGIAHWRQAWRSLSLRQAQHHVGDDAGDRDVEPDGKGPAGDFAVLRECGRRAKRRT